MSEQKRIGRMRLQAGQSLFCINLRTGEITDMHRPRSVEVQEGYFYAVALNRKSFIKKLIRKGTIRVVPKD